MIKRLIVLLLIASFTAMTPAFSVNTQKATAATTQVTKEKKGTLIIKKVNAPSLKNNIIGELLTQNIAVYLPPNYSTSGKKYPVLYFLPGYGDDYDTYGSMFKMLMDKLLASGKANEMIVICINGKNRFHGSFYVNSPVIGNWQDFIVKDVIPYVDGNFRTIKSAKGRGIAGHSMGGFGVLNLVMNCPGIFDSAYSMSPGIFAPGGLKDGPFDFSYLQDTGLRKLSKEEYVKRVEQMGWNQDVTFAYGSAFAYDVKAGIPFIQCPKGDIEKGWTHDKIWARWENGFGNLVEKVNKSKKNLLKLKAFTIEYGNYEENTWIPAGCKYFTKLLKKAGIPHKLVSFDGGHQDMVIDRVEKAVIPFFSQNINK